MKQAYKIGELIRVTCNRGKDNERIAILKVVKCDSCQGCVYSVGEHGPLGQFSWGCKLRSKSYCKKPERFDGNNIIYKLVK